jgi:hypothetical protein
VTDYTREVRRRLSEAGWQFQRPGKGDHERWINLKSGAKIRSRHAANKILIEAGIGKKF